MLDVLLFLLRTAKFEFLDADLLVARRLACRTTDDDRVVVPAHSLGAGVDSRLLVYDQVVTL